MVRQAVERKQYQHVKREFGLDEARIKLMQQREIAPKRDGSVAGQSA